MIVARKSRWRGIEGRAHEAVAVLTICDTVRVFVNSVRVPSVFVEVTVVVFGVIVVEGCRTVAGLVTIIGDATIVAVKILIEVKLLVWVEVTENVTVGIIIKVC